MWIVLKQEIKSFFSSSVGFLIIGVFILVNGLILFVFRGDFNIFDYGFADLRPFFLWLPWILLFLIPAITMRSFSEEFKAGTIELLKIKPVSTWKLVFGKFLGAWILVILAIIPSLVYISSIDSLILGNEELDKGILFSSYLGLIFLAGVYSAIGIFTSSTTFNQIVAFVMAVLTCWILYAGFEGIGTLLSGETSLFVEGFGIKSHFDDFTRGVVPLGSLIYMISLILFFLYITQRNVKREI